MSEENSKIATPSYLDGNSNQDQRQRQKQAKAISSAETPAIVKVKAKPVIQGKVAKRKKPAAQRLRESLGLESSRTVGDYLVWDVLVPAAKEMVADLVTKGIQVFLYGGATSSSRKGERGYVSYSGFSSSRRSARRPEPRPYQRGARFDSRDYELDYQEDADVVLAELCEMVDLYGHATIADFYTEIGLSESATYMDKEYGWDALGSANVMPVETVDGIKWVVNLPKPVRI